MTKKHPYTPGPHLHPSTLAFPECSNCRTTGVYNKDICPCVIRRLNAERAAAQTPWEELWFDQFYKTDYFPPNPIPQSSLCPSKTYYFTSGSSPRP